MTNGERRTNGRRRLFDNVVETVGDTPCIRINSLAPKHATIYVKDELGRLNGVAGITYLGQRDYSLRAWLDPDRLAALKLGAMDVVNAIAQQNIQVAAGQIGQPPADRAQQFQLTINTRGRLTDPEEFAAIIVKADVSGLRFKSYSRITAAGFRGSVASPYSVFVVPLVCRLHLVPS